MELPSHITQAQASRFLEISKQTVMRNTLHGGLLEAEKILGTEMIPKEKVIAYKEFLDERKRKQRRNGSRRAA